VVQRPRDPSRQRDRVVEPDIGRRVVSVNDFERGEIHRLLVALYGTCRSETRSSSRTHRAFLVERGFDSARRLGERGNIGVEKRTAISHGRHRQAHRCSD
jgi:hypothetical protein